jgi:hypothetical protein
VPFMLILLPCVSRTPLNQKRTFLRNSEFYESDSDCTGIPGQQRAAYALSLAPHMSVRTGEMRFGQSREIDFNAAKWRIPANKVEPLEATLRRVLREELRTAG